MRVGYNNASNRRWSLVAARRVRRRGTRDFSAPSHPPARLVDRSECLSGKRDPLDLLCRRAGASKSDQRRRPAHHASRISIYSKQRGHASIYSYSPSVQSDDLTYARFDCVPRCVLDSAHVSRVAVVAVVTFGEEDEFK